MSSPQINPKRLFFLRTITPFAVLVLLAFLAEIFLRVIRYDPMGPYLKLGRNNFFFRLSPNKYLGYEPNPDFEGVIYKEHLRINSAGFRGPEYEVKKKNHFRIIVLGDSITLDLKVKEENTFVALLEKALKQTDPKYEVLNFGVDGYDTYQEVLFLESHGLKFSPDMVLVAYCLNDIGVIPLDKRTMLKLANPDLPSYLHLRIGQWLYLRFRKLELIREMETNIKKSDWSEEFYGDLFQPVEKDKYLAENFRQIRRIQKSFRESDIKSKFIVASGKRLWLNQYLSLKNIGKLRNSFESLHGLSLKHGFEPLVLIIPFFYKVNGEYLDFPAHLIVRREAERCGLEVLDLFDQFNAVGLEKVTRDGVHLNDNGHEILARILLEELQLRWKDRRQ